MLRFSLAISHQVRFLLQSLNERGVESVTRELCQFVDYGYEESILVLQTCLGFLASQKIDVNISQLGPVIVSVFKHVMGKPNFSTVFCQSLRNAEINESFLDNLSNLLQLSILERIIVGLALFESENLDARICGRNFSSTQIEKLCTDPVPIDSMEQLQNVVLFLLQSEDPSKDLDSIMQIVSMAQNKDAEFVLSPLLPKELHEANLLSRNMDLLEDFDEGEFDAILAEMEKERSLGDIMKDLSYGCTLDATQCKEILSQFLPINEVTISRVLGVLARNHSGLEENQNTISSFGLALGCNLQSELPSQNSWNIDVLVKTLEDLAPGTDWMQVIENLDHDDFSIANEESFSLLMSVYRTACQKPFPLHVLCSSVWKNCCGQLSFLKYALLAPPELFTFADSPRQQEYSETLRGLKFQIGCENPAWLRLDVLDLLCQIAEKGLASSVRSLLEFPLKNCPEVLLLGMAHITTPYNLIQHEVARVVFPIVVKSGSGAGSIILHLWNTNPNLMLRGFIDSLNFDLDDLAKVFDTFQQLKILSSVLEMTPFSLSIRLAILASFKEHLNLEKWLSVNINTHKDIFSEECIKFVKEIHSRGATNFTPQQFNLSGAVLKIFLEKCPILTKVLKAHTGVVMSNQLSEEIQRLSETIIDARTELQNGVAADSSNPDGFGDDVEAEANSYFHQMFSGQMSIDSMVQMLARFKESSDEREHQIFDCMIANLFEEYRFFPKYPERQLKIAAVLFGSVIKHQLVTHLTLGIALRGVLDALRKPPDSKMFVFGTKALEMFVERLIEWPQYCNHILQISHLRSTHPDIVGFIERALARISSGHLETEGGGNPSVLHQHVASGNGEMTSAAPAHPGQQAPQLHLQQRSETPVAPISEPNPLLPSPGQPVGISSGDATNTQKISSSASGLLSMSPGFVRPTRGATSTRFGSALNIETLVAAAERREIQIQSPASEVQDKISFIINNISSANIEAKAKEFNEVLKVQYYPWFAQYMVMKRASIEPNFHDLYLKFLDKVNSKTLYREIVQATYENCKVLLGSELIKSSSEERSLLKNLGSWLGKLTIGRNQVLKAREIDPKSLIIEAYEKGLMIAVIPFTSKILEPCLNSMAYKPPNPWTMGILGLLSEIYSMPNLKMNLKFDIEVLFKNLGVDIKDVPPTSLLKDRKRAIEGNPDFSNKDVTASQPQMISEVKSGGIPSLGHIELPLDVSNPTNSAGHSSMLPQYAAPLRLPSGSLMENEKVAPLSLSDQLPSAQGLFQSTPSQPFSVSQLSTPIPNIGTHVIINQKLTALGLHLPFQRAVPLAMDRAIKEIVSSIVQRSVSIASQTTKELVLKDYAMELDETRIYNAAHLMVASLAGSLAHVTCKEPLRSSISSHLRNSYQGPNISNELLEQAVQLVTNDNLDLGCAIIEQAATDKAIQTIDGEIRQQLVLRRKHHRDGVGSQFFEPSIYAQSSFGVVPESLRPKPGHLSVSQQRVYEDFVRLPWQNQSSQGPHSMPVPSSSSDGGLPSAYGSISGQPKPGYPPAPVTMGFDAISRSSDVSATSESVSAALMSAPIIPAGTPDIVGQHASESELVNATFPQVVSNSDLHTADSSNIVKEPGATTHPTAAATERLGTGIADTSLTTRDALDSYQILAQKLETLVANDAGEADIQVVVSEVPEIILRCISRDEAGLAVAQKAFKGLYENASNSLHVSAYLSILAASREVCKLVVKELTSWVIYSDEERKFNKEITLGLIRSELLNLAEYNLHMAKLIDGGRNKAATEFSISLLQSLHSEDSRAISELHNLVDSLAKLSAKPGSPESLQHLIETIRNPTAILPSGKDDRVKQLKEKKAASREDHISVEPVEPDSAAFREQVSMLFAEWYQICELPGANEAAYTHYVVQLHQNGLLKGDEITERFFRRLMELSVAHCLSSEVISSGTLQTTQQAQNLSFLAIDIFAKLVFSVMKYCPMEHGSNKLILFSKILNVTMRFIQKDSEDKKASFNPRPYFRLFINWIVDLGSLEPVADGANSQILIALASAFHALQPLKIPSFSYAWLELISHRSFMPKLLTVNGQKGWPYVQRLLVDLFQFLEPFLRNAELGVAVQYLYRGTLRVLLVLLHDFPEFLCAYHFTFCDVIPPSCIQMRNIILSAFPRNMRLPDPSTPNLKIDLLPEIKEPPHVLSEVEAALKAKLMKNDVDEYLKSRPQNSPFLMGFKQRLLLPPNEAASAGTRFNVPLINSLVLYVGMQAIQQLQGGSGHGQLSGNAAPMGLFVVEAALEFFKTLVLDLDTEGRYLFLNAIANQLRYPNNHTHYFSFILLFLFHDSNQEMIQEQITRVLLERLIVNRPHPWGLLITFIELIKNPRYNFWKRGFIRCAPEIEKLFESVARSCGGLHAIDDSMVSVWGSESAH